MAAPRASPPTTAPAATGARHPYPRQRASAWSGMATAASVINAACATTICFAFMINASVLAVAESVALKTFCSFDLGQRSRQRDARRYRHAPRGRLLLLSFDLSKRGGRAFRPRTH